MDVITVTGLHAYPVKSCAGVDLQQARVTPRGLEFDRDFMVVDDENDFVSQRKVPELALVVPTIGDGAITLTAPGMEAVQVPLELEADAGALITATVHRRPMTGQVVREDLNDWFTTFLPPYKDNRRFRLLRVREDVPTYIKDRYQKAGASNLVGFADGSAMLLASEPSLAQLNMQLDEPVPMNRFRPNIVVDGADLPTTRTSGLTSRSAGWTRSSSRRRTGVPLLTQTSAPPLSARRSVAHCGRERVSTLTTTPTKGCFSHRT